MEVQVILQSPDSNSIAEGLFGSDSQSLERNKTEKAVVDGVSLRFEGVYRQFSACVDSQSTALFLEMAISFGRDVALPIAVSVLSRYIYDKLKYRKAEGIKIGNTYIKINSTQIINQQIIYQTIINEAAQQQKRDDTKTEN